MTSKLEIRIYTELKTLFDEVKWRAKIEGYECDIFLPKYKLGIEIDGGYWHDNRQEKDKQKGKYLRERGITLLRLRDEALDKVEDSDTLYKYRESHLKTLQKILQTMMENTSFSTIDQVKISDYVSSERFSNDQEYRKILSQLPNPPYESSLQHLYPGLVKEWHYEKNAPLEPSMFLPGSEIKVLWTCSNDSSHDYTATIASRVSGSGCPFCPSAKSGRRASNGYNLETEYPEIAKEWHPTKNLPLTPHNVTPYSDRKIIWECAINPEHEWRETPNHRTRMKIGCPICSGHRVSDLNSIASRFPVLAMEWHPTKNGDLTPEQVSLGSTRKIWWKCEKCEHEWRTTPNSRSQGRNCPKCAKEKRIETRRKILV